MSGDSAADRFLVEVGAAVDRNTTAIQGLNLKVEAVANAQIAQAARLALLKPATPAAGDGAPAPYLDWVTVDDEPTAVMLLERVASWVQQVWSQYTPIRACWCWHPPVVAELAACQAAHAASLREDASPLAPADWHTRWRPASHKTITQVLAACMPKHRVGDAEYDVDPTAGPAYAAWWARHHQSAPDLTLPPGLIPAEEPR